MTALVHRATRAGWRLKLLSCLDHIDCHIEIEALSAAFSYRLPEMGLDNFRKLKRHAHPHHIESNSLAWACTETWAQL